MGSSGLEPPTSRLSGVRSNHLSYEPMCTVRVPFLPVPPSLFQERVGGDEEDRTPDPLLARQVLSQLSYTPTGSQGFQVRLRIPLKISLQTLKIKQHFKKSQTTCTDQSQKLLIRSFVSP